MKRETFFLLFVILATIILLGSLGWYHLIYNSLAKPFYISFSFFSNYFSRIFANFFASVTSVIFYFLIGAIIGLILKLSKKEVSIFKSGIISFLIFLLIELMLFSLMEFGILKSLPFTNGYYISYILFSVRIIAYIVFWMLIGKLMTVIPNKIVIKE